VYCCCRRRHDQLCHQRGRPAADAAARLPAEPAHLAPCGPALAKDYTVVLADLRGYGDSGKPAPTPPPGLVTTVLRDFFGRVPGDTPVGDAFSRLRFYSSRSPAGAGLRR